MRMKFYSLKNILEKNAQYNLIIGERSNGKTYACLDYMIKRYFETGEQGAIIRRWQDDIRGARAANMFNGHVDNDLIRKYSKGKFTTIYYYSGAWYMANYDEELKKYVPEQNPFCYAFAISTAEHNKSVSYPNITTIVFDEFLTRGTYITDEFVQYMNLLSTIIRNRNNVKIFMLGNTVNKYSPYFAEMGLTHIQKMEKGKIDVYTYGESGLRVAVEFSDNPNKSKPSDLYFAFNNPKLQMITSGAWELDIYPHLPMKYDVKNIKYVFYIIFDSNVLECEIIVKDKQQFIFIHRKTTALHGDPDRLVFTPEHNPAPNYRRKITKSNVKTKIEKKIFELFYFDKVFYQDNEIGEVVRNYLVWCKGNQ